MGNGPEDATDADRAGDRGTGVPVLHVAGPAGVDDPAIPVGATIGMTEADWLDLDGFHGGDHSLIEFLKKVAPGYDGRDESTMDDGSVLHHHGLDECSGNCCLHGTSLYESCNRPMLWHGKLEHKCPCGVGHPCEAGVAYAVGRGRDYDDVHGCCGVEGHCSRAAAYVPPQRQSVDGEVIWPSEPLQGADGLEQMQRQIAQLMEHADAARNSLNHLDETGTRLFTKLFKTAHLHNLLFAKVLEFTGRDSRAIDALQAEVEKLKTRLYWSHLFCALACGAAGFMVAFTASHWPK